MASRGPRSKLEHETRAKRQKIEAPREPRRPKTHWDHVLEEMVWLSKDFESERKWKLGQAKKVALKASRGMLDQATRGERKLKEEEHRLRKVALNISKDVKKFWMKIEKLVLYKHQMELDEKKKKALDKQLEFLLGQTERYSTMLAENLVDTCKPVQDPQFSLHCKEDDEKEAQETSVDIGEPEFDNVDIDVDYDVQSEDISEDDELTIAEDEALITEGERQEELLALQTEADLPLEELLKRYSTEKEISDGREVSLEKGTDGDDTTLLEENNGELDSPPVVSKNETTNSLVVTGRRSSENNGELSIVENRSPELKMSEHKNLLEASAEFSKDRAVYDFSDEHEDIDFVLVVEEEKDDEATLSEEEQLAKADSNNPMEEISLLQKESEIPIEELLARYKKESYNNEDTNDESEYASASSEDLVGSPSPEERELIYQSSPEERELKHQDASLGVVVKHGGCHPVTHPSTEDQQGSLKRLEEREGEDRIADAAAAARSAQPTGNTFSTTKVRTKFPFLLKYPLREYQHIGLDWLVTMYDKRLNGILADEMGLGKTIMTIALLAHLACEKGIWGPHLIVVPTSVMLNWETEFLKWCPAFKILTYFGSAKERKFKRQGWLKPNFFHVCITTYRLVIQDSKVFKRKKWKYLILDEAHLIKNWKSQRWQTLLNFNSKRRILLTGTPLQNDLMELWSLMHFLMPHIFQSHQEFKDWFSNPITGMVEGQEKVNKEVIDRLHNVLRPFILRRLKRDVEKQLPMKVEHVIYCRLSRRQRNLYEDFIASSETQATLASANFFGMISVIMQLRKVCNHPDLFEGRPIISSFDMTGIDMQLSSSVCSMLSCGPFSRVNLKGYGLLFTHLDFKMTSWESDEVKSIATPSSSIKACVNVGDLEKIGPGLCDKGLHGTNIFVEIQKAILEERVREAKKRAEAIAWWNSLSCKRKPMYSSSLRDLVTIRHPVFDIHHQKENPVSYSYSSKLADIILTPVERLQRMVDLVESFMFAIPPARAPPPVCWCSGKGSHVFLDPAYKQKYSQILSPLLTPVRPTIVRRQVYFPDRRLIQFDCGKLQKLAVLLRKLKSEGHRALIFTQMTKMLDILEAFINLYGYTYMRLDGSTQPEERQTLMQRFNTNPKIFLFILSTRSGGVGINLVGADTVIFYDSDWNPAMDQQAQDRCHRIGQTREVHIYRLISESTIEENILKKANQKRALDNLVIQSGDYNTEFFKKLDPMELFSGHRSLKNMQKEENNNNKQNELSVSNADVEAALKLAEDEADYMALKKVEQEEAVDNQEFTEEAIGRVEEDEFVNDEDMKVDESGDLGSLVMASNKDNGVVLNMNDPHEQEALVVTDKEDDVDMLDDVREMAAAAAAAGQEISSLENQLRPIDRYAIRFLELWDPIINKAAAESPVSFEETEWELDRIEKYKEEMEAEIDEDEEPLVYESWDADFATEAYRQQVEALAQHLLMEELESEAKEMEDARDGNCDYNKCETPKPKSKKKSKKAKFKSLKKRSLASELKPVEEEPSTEPMLTDNDIIGDEDVSETAASPTHVQKKRKKVVFTVGGKEENSSKKKSKKLKKNASERSLDLDPNLSVMQPYEHVDSKPCEIAASLEQKLVGRSRMGGKISITSMPLKRVLMIKPEKIKKTNIWSRDSVPSPDFWFPQEDAILCAMVHEYGPNWSFVSETLYGMTAGGFYRGRYRHPVYCCERYRELIQRFVLSASDHLNNEKIINAGSGKALLKVTEDNIRLMLDVAADQPDREFLLQKHFTVLLTSVWKTTFLVDCRKKLSSSHNSLNLIPRNFVMDSTSRMHFINLGQSRKSIAAALLEVTSVKQVDRASRSDQVENDSINVGRLELTLQFETDDYITSVPLPPVVNLSVLDSDRLPTESTETTDHHLKISRDIAENRFRAAARTCTEDSLEWASSVFPTNDVKGRTSLKVQSLGKNKPTLSEMFKPGKPKSRKTAFDETEMPSFTSKELDERFPLMPHVTSADGIENNNLLFGMDGELAFGTESLEMVPDTYIPGLVSSLDDCSLSSELEEIG